MKVILSLAVLVCMLFGVEPRVQAQTPDLSISFAKVQTAPDPVLYGVVWTNFMVLRNTSAAVARNVVVTNKFSSPVIVLSNKLFGSSTQLPYAVYSNVVVTSLGDFALSATFSHVLYVQPTQAGGLTNTAMISCDQVETNIANNVATTNCTAYPMELSVFITASPTQVVANYQNLTYTVTVTNRGLLPATEVVLTNVLDSTLSLVSVTPSQGSYITNTGTPIICNLGTIPGLGSALVTIVALPTVATSVKSSMYVGALEPNAKTARIGATNTNTVVGFNVTANLVMGMAATNSMIDQTNFYIIGITNLGPATATGILFKDVLPQGAIFVPELATNSHGVSMSFDGKAVKCSLTNMEPGAIATVTIPVVLTNAGFATNVASVTASQIDLTPASAVATTLVRVGTDVAVWGASSSSQIFLGDSVIYTITVTNQGPNDATGVVLDSRLMGVDYASASSTLGTLRQANGDVILSINLLAAGKSATLTIEAVANRAGWVTNINQVSITDPVDLQSANDFFELTNFVVAAGVYRSDSPITIRDASPADPYPSVINISDLTGVIQKVTVALVGISHGYLADIGVLLESPSGKSVVLMANAGGNVTVSNLTLLFDDEAASVLPQHGAVNITSSRPVNYGLADDFSPPAPIGPYGSRLSELNGTDGNGEWKLYVIDTAGGAAGVINSGWTLKVTTVSTNKIADVSLEMTASPEPVSAGSSLNYFLIVSNAGPNPATGVVVSNRLPASADFVSVNVSQGDGSLVDGAVMCNIGTIDAGGIATVTCVFSPRQAGLLTNVARAFTKAGDLDLSNNTARLVSTVLPMENQVLQVHVSSSPNPAALGMDYIVSQITVTNPGPWVALNTRLSSVLPTGLYPIAVTTSQGSNVFGPGAVDCSFGDIAVGSGVVATIVLKASETGSFTNYITVTSDQPELDPNRVTHVILVTPVADLGIVIQDSGDPVALGSAMFYTLTVSNAGPSSATNVQVAATLSDNLKVLSTSTSQGTAMIYENNVLYRVGTLAKGQQAVIQVQANAFASGAGYCTATVSSDVADTKLLNNTVTQATVVNDGIYPLPYPVVTTLSGLTGLVNRVVVTVTNLNYGYASDLALLLVGPQGQSAVLMANAGGSSQLQQVTLQFSDAATNRLPETEAIVSGSYQPTQYGTVRPFPAPAPTLIYGSALSAFSGTDANGDWKLYVMHEPLNDIGLVMEGWCLSVATVGVKDTADLGIGLTASSGAIVAGENLAYTILVTNWGPGTASNAVFKDTLPANVVFISAMSGMGRVDFINGEVIGLLGDVPPGRIVPLNITVMPLQAGSFTNRVSISSDQLDLVMANNTAALAVTVLPNPNLADLRLTAVHTAGPVNAGQRVSYSLTLSNAGPTTAHNVVVTNLFSAPVEVVNTIISTGTSHVVGSKLVEFRFDSLKSKEVVTMILIVKTTGDGWLTNQVRVGLNEIDLIMPQKDIAILALPAADLMVTQMDLQDPTPPGSSATYLITVANLGPSTASSVVLYDFYPYTATVTAMQTSQGSIRDDGRVLMGDLGAIPSGSQATLRVSLLPNGGAPISNQVSVSSVEFDPNMTNNESVERTSIATATTQTANLTILNATSADPVFIGTVMDLKMVVTNQGPNTAHDVTLLDTLPTGVTYVSASVSQGTFQESGGALTFALGVVEVGKAITITISVTPTQPGSLMNQARVFGAELDLVPADNMVSIPIPVLAGGITANPAPITILDASQANPYPSVIQVSGLTGEVGRVEVTLTGFSHSFPHDVGVLLVSPSGQNVVLMNNAGVGKSATNATLHFTDDATGVLAERGQIVSGDYQPVNYGPSDVFFPDAPQGPYGSRLADLAGAAPNGAWKLFIMDDQGGDAGVLVSGWSLNIVTRAIRPRLRWNRVGDQVQILWSASEGVWRLESSPTMAPGSWTLFGVSPLVSGPDNVVQAPIAPGNKYFRLSQP